MEFPTTRLQRYRQKPQVRQLVSETSLEAHQLIQPLFVHEGLIEKRPIPALPGIYQHSFQSLMPELERLAESGVQSLLLFGVPKEKDELGSEAMAEEGVIQRTLELIRQNFPDFLLITDCCLCGYTSHGHCSLMNNKGMDHAGTLESLKSIALSHASRGADLIAPSGMIDGMVGAIRQALDAAGYSEKGIMSYSVKYASHFYGPFREAAGSKDAFKGDRKHHQLSYTQKREAIREALLDVSEGADFLMVKPALPYLDIIQQLRQTTLLPIVAYQVSGEYAMIKAAAASGMLDEHLAFEETLTSIRRAGADLIITYYAEQWCQSC